MINHKDDKNKPRPSLMPPEALLQITKVFNDGAKKYGTDNWRDFADGDIARYTDALYRHLLAFISGEVFDPETGSHHMAHIASNAMIILALEKIRDAEEKAACLR